MFCAAPSKCRGARFGPSVYGCGSIGRIERDELALRLVAEGLGIAIAPQTLATDTVVARHVKGIDAVRSIGLKWRADLDSEILTAVLDASSSIEFTPH